jgi:hypothetical protein
MCRKKSRFERGSAMMRLFILAFTLLVSASSLADAADDAAAKMHEYFAIFNEKNVFKVAHEIYATPVQVGGIPHRIYADPDAAIENLTGLYPLIESQGWVESRILNTEVCIASANLAFVDTQFSRLDKNGDAIAPAIRRSLYVLQKHENEWRIVAFYVHDADVVPTCNMEMT